jgi:hypothetical protein
VLAIRWRLKSELADAAYELAIDLQTGDQLMITARYVLDATEEADLLPLRECGWAVGAESASRIGEPHVLDGSADPRDVFRRSLNIVTARRGPCSTVSCICHPHRR